MELVDELDEEDLEDDDDALDDDLDPDLAEDADLPAVETLDADAPPEAAVPVAVPAAVAEGEEEEDVLDLDEELHPDDVEEALDVVLRERTVAAGLEDDEDDEEPDERGEGGTKIVPRRENEFLCRSCFLVLPRHQLADEKRMICRDCV